MRPLSLCFTLLCATSSATSSESADDGPVPARPSTGLRSAFAAPETTAPRTDVAPFEYVDVGPKIPNYPPSNRWGTQERPHTKMQKPLSPEESIKHFVTPAGFEVRLFASEPDLGAKPISMNWDEQGRLWVCETVDYPNELQPPGQGRDRVRICEDVDGDGRADKFTLFAENLSIPTAVLPIYGGAIVQNGTETLFLQDVDGDDKADVREVLISGWTLGDTHGGVSNFQYGLDNWIWAMQGYNDSQPVIDGVKQQRFRMGFFRFKLERAEQETSPRVTALEFLRSTNNNTWGLGFSEEGLVFGSTANGNPSVYMPISNRYYERVRGWSPTQLSSIADTYQFAPLSEKVRQVDWHGGYTAGAGHALYTARQFPQQWWNRTAFVCEPTGKLVGTFVLTPEGADYRSTSPINLLASDDEWSAPIMAEVGPDGAVWVLDWYNYVVQHNPTPQGFQKGKGNAYVSDLRDKQHGRIYRVVYVGDSERAESDATDQGADVPRSPEALVEALRHPTMLRRKLAQRLLVERGERDVVPALIELVQDRTVDAIGLSAGAIHALWTLHGLGQLEQPVGKSYEAAANALKHPSAGVRRNAVQALPPCEESAKRILPIVDDPDAQVRLSALLALADVETSEDVGRSLAELIRKPAATGDQWAADALTSAAAAHAVPTLANLANGGNLPDGRATSVVTIVAEHIARGRPSDEATNRVVNAATVAAPRAAAAIMNGLSAGWPEDYRIDLAEEVDQNLKPLFQRLPPGAKGQLVGLASRWGSQALESHADGIVDALLTNMRDGSLSPSDRVDAARQLIGFRQRDESVVQKVLEAVTPQATPDLTHGLIDAVAFSRAANLGRELIDRTTSMTPFTRRVAVDALLGRTDTAAELLQAIQSNRMRMSDLSLEQQRFLAGHPERAVRIQALRLLARGGSLADPDRDQVLKQLLAVTHQEGDVSVGQAMFVKHCAKCHQHAHVEADDLDGLTTQNVGPNLTGMAVHPKAELLRQIIDPSRSVEGNFRLYTVVTKGGRVFSGMLASETRTSIELVDTNAKRRSLIRDEIDELQATRKSVMPDGFEKQMTPQELSSLLSFLTRRGKYLPLDLRKAATIVSTKPMFYGRSPAERLIFEDWGLKTFSDVPFLLVDPQGDRQPNVILLYGPEGRHPPQMPKSVALPVNATAGEIHLLSGIGGWSHPAHQGQSTSMILRLTYEDGQTEDHEFRNGVHFADYVRRVDVPGSEFAFDLSGRQVRYLSVTPKRQNTVIRELAFVKGGDRTAPIVMAVTVESPE